ncbi:TerB family tellurite resistance protein [Paenibacillus sp. NPDC056579]|uniref:TerB family tellurite resistance protein n=1 Tax=Paenibacillus sp. NPDC056579 TaxID=3345871 RepID=UPI003692B207
MFLHFLQSREHKKAFLELAQVVAQVDGFVSGKERGYLHTFMDEMNMSQDLQVISEARKLPDIVEDLKEDHVKDIVFMEILLLMYVDGDYNDEEKQIVKDLKELFGFSDEKYEAFRSWVIRMDQLKIEGMKLILNTK